MVHACAHACGVLVDVTQSPRCLVYMFGISYHTCTWPWSRVREAGSHHAERVAADHRRHVFLRHASLSQRWPVHTCTGSREQSSATRLIMTPAAARGTISIATAAAPELARGSTGAHATMCTHLQQRVRDRCHVRRVEWRGDRAVEVAAEGHVIDTSNLHGMLDGSHNVRDSGAAQDLRSDACRMARRCNPPWLVQSQAAGHVCVRVHAHNTHHPTQPRTFLKKPMPTTPPARATATNSSSDRLRSNSQVPCTPVWDTTNGLVAMLATSSTT